jgi:hypothetical protein
MFVCPRLVGAGKRFFPNGVRLKHSEGLIVLLKWLIFNSVLLVIFAQTTLRIAAGIRQLSLHDHSRMACSAVRSRRDRLGQEKSGERIGHPSSVETARQVSSQVPGPRISQMSTVSQSGVQSELESDKLSRVEPRMQSQRFSG